MRVPGLRLRARTAAPCERRRHALLQVLRHSCNRRINATDLSPFRGARLTLVSLLRILTFYARSNRTLSPLVAEATSQLGLKRTAVENVYNTLRSRESAAGMRFSKAKTLAGNVEGQALCDVS